MVLLKVDDPHLKLANISRATFSSEPITVEIGPGAWANIRASQLQLMKLIETRVPIYGVTTGFGDSARRMIDGDKMEKLQDNLISYLLCGTGPNFSREISRAILICRLKSLARGLSGVSPELVERMKLHVERDWIPAIPQEGSLGASGDLIPLAYLARTIQGRGMIFGESGDLIPIDQVLKKEGIEPYVLKPKEGLALVNGTSTMAGLAIVNLRHIRALIDLSILGTSWSCMALNGRPEAFGRLVNSEAKAFMGQAKVAERIHNLLTAENYSVLPLAQITSNGRQLTDFVQDRYSLRCAPQILGPIIETLEQGEDWLETEINGVSDNPIISPDGDWALGGNFYGGYIGHSMDYLKMGLGHIADMVDRQMTTVIDEKSNRGLPPNLADWPNLPEDERFLHHGLKGLHQAVSALTSEAMARSIPNGIFSRSAESHNQDKVSLGLSSGVQCAQMVETLFTIQAHHFIALAQALDLRGRALRGIESLKMYDLVRSKISRVTGDQPLDHAVRSLASAMRASAEEGE